MALPSLFTTMKSPPLSTSAPHWLESPLLHPCSPLPGLEESRARLLRPITPSTQWLASLKPPDTRNQLLLDPLRKPCASITAETLQDSEAQYEASSLRYKREQPWVDEDDVDFASSMPSYTLMVPEDELLDPLQVKDTPVDRTPCSSKEKELQKCKLTLVNLACCSLVEGPKFGDCYDVMRQMLEQTCKSLAEHEPEFILKVALYTRQELNIRATANFLLALASHLPPCRPHVRRYFCAAMQLPSDWMEVAKLFQSLAENEEAVAPMPSCLRASMTDKFRQFDEYQLAKYNSRKSRGKGPQRKKPKQSKSFQEESEAPKTEARMDPFSLKALIRRLHISEPAKH
uniref:TROVE domain-containing protein n=1 Tax=Sphenodon punctatus TaxID=8508 RepID=A0A8D0G0L6_SPHPU